MRDDNVVAAALIRRLNSSLFLTESDIKAIRELPFQYRSISADELIFSEGSKIDECCLISDGFLARSKTLGDGRRQILSFHIAGEMPDLLALFLDVMDHDLFAVTNCDLAFVSHAAMIDLIDRRPNLAKLLWRDTLVDAAIFREWIVNIGQRPAPARLAQMVIELRERLRVALGNSLGSSVPLPLTQEQVGEALGITLVHTNRVLRQLREDGTLDVQRGVATIISERKIQELADFRVDYLHHR